MAHAPAPGDAALAARLARELEGEVLFDAFSRGRYSTDASIYQVEPVGVVVPRNTEDVVRAMQIANDAGVPILPRGGGTSQCGQTVGQALVLDCTRHLNRIDEVDAAARTVTVQPGTVLDTLNRRLKPHGLFYPVDVSTANRATLGGMAGNNSCGARSIRYGNMVHNVRAIDAVLADGTRMHFGEVPGNLGGEGTDAKRVELVARLRGIAAREAAELAARFPKLLRRVGGYNIDTLSPEGHNMAHLLVGSEGTLAAFTGITLDLQPIPRHRVLGVCHFPTFYAAMDATRHIVELQPSAVELVDRTMIELSREIAMFRPIVERFVKATPDAILLVEFAGEELEPERARLRQLGQLMGELGFADAVVDATAFQTDVWEVRKAGLNIMMSMKSAGKPVSFIEDCAVALSDLAEYTDRLTQVFHKHGTSGTWYAHASVGCLHVRPVLDMRKDGDVAKMRAIAEEAFAMVREYKGSHSGEHGDGLVRSEFHEAMFGPRIVRAFEEVKDAFDPKGLMNPGKIVRPPRMDDRTLFRFKPGYATRQVDVAMDWSAWGGFAGAVEMCNNNGACRKPAGGVMCPSFRVTGEEKHLTRGRANSLRLALSGQLGEDALTAPEMAETMSLCVGCKGCRRECPTGVDMARMKSEFLRQYHRRHGLPLKERLIANLPRYAPLAAALAPLANLRNRIPALAALGERSLGISRRRSLPAWRRDAFRDTEAERAGGDGRAGEVALLADTFNRWFEPQNLRAAVRVLARAGYRVRTASAGGGRRALCCGRTYLAAGMLDEARAELERTRAALLPLVRAGIPVIGLEPSCTFTLRDELGALLPGDDAEQIAAGSFMFEEFLAREHEAGRLDLPLRALPSPRLLLHGHCHQKAFAALSPVERVLGLVPGAELSTVEASCCGMAGAFGYDARHYAVSVKMAELDLMPAVRAAAADTTLVADGTSCRHQIADLGQREAVHVARVLERALAP